MHADGKESGEATLKSMATRPAKQQNKNQKQKQKSENNNLKKKKLPLWSPAKKSLTRKNTEVERQQQQQQQRPGEETKINPKMQESSNFKLGGLRSGLSFGFCSTSF